MIPDREVEGLRPTPGKTFKTAPHPPTNTHTVVKSIFNIGLLFYNVLYY